MRVTRHDDAPREPRPPAQRRSFDEVLERTGAGGATAGHCTGAIAGASASAPATQQGTQQGTPAPALPELREAARAIPPALWAGRTAGGEGVELSFGRDLSVELRQGAGGIELSIRTSPALTRAAQVDLPAFLKTLRGHGVVVVRAEVRGRSHGSASRSTPRRVGR
jgi:hypothetical protein